MASSHCLCQVECDWLNAKGAISELRSAAQLISNPLSSDRIQRESSIAIMNDAVSIIQRSLGYLYLFFVFCFKSTDFFTLFLLVLLKDILIMWLNFLLILLFLYRLIQGCEYSYLMIFTSLYFLNINVFIDRNGIFVRRAKPTKFSAT